MTTEKILKKIHCQIRSGAFLYGKMGVFKAGPLRKPDKRCHGFSVSIGEAHPLAFSAESNLVFSKDLEGMGCGGIGDDAEKFEMHLGEILLKSTH